MRSDPDEYKEIIKKLLEKTRQGRVQWEQASHFGEVRLRSSDTFRCDVGEGQDSFSFEVTNAVDQDGTQQWLSMTDRVGNEIFRVVANDLPTSQEEEETTKIMAELYELARRQALKIEQKLELASSLLDRV